jgi:hypothetical protein
MMGVGEFVEIMGLVPGGKEIDRGTIYDNILLVAT